MWNASPRHCKISQDLTIYMSVGLMRTTSTQCRTEGLGLLKLATCKKKAMRNAGLWNRILYLENVNVRESLGPRKHTTVFHANDLHHFVNDKYRNSMAITINLLNQNTKSLVQGSTEALGKFAITKEISLVQIPVTVGSTATKLNMP